MSIGVHVFGPGFGECVVLELPNRHIGIVDFFQFGTATPLRDYITERFGGRIVDFLAITHPHADHCTGLAQLLSSFPVSRYWIFGGFELTELIIYFDKLARLGRREAIEASLATKSTTVGAEILRFGAHVKSRLRAGAADLAYLTRPRFEKLCQGEVGIDFIVPTDGEIFLYSQILAESCRKMPAATSTPLAAWKPDHVNHNLVSGSLLVQYGETRIALLSDAEQPLWQTYLAATSDQPRAHLHFLKVAHHGSETGLSMNQWVQDDRKYLLDEFHVACYFDNRGNEERTMRDVGWGAGTLPSRASQAPLTSGQRRRSA